MTNEPTMFLLIDTLKKATNPLSSRGIAEFANIDPSSENLQAIKHEMFDLVEAGKATKFYVDRGNPAWFFSLI